MKYLLLILFTTFSFAHGVSGKVVSISDGDTFTLLDDKNVQHKIRLAEIDAPENSQPFGKADLKIHWFQKVEQKFFHWSLVQNQIGAGPNGNIL